MIDLRLTYSVPEDYPELWQKWTRKFRGSGSEKRVKALRVMGKAFVALYVIMYLVLGWACLITSPTVAIGYVFSTAICFILVSAYRKWRNEPRPYEVFDMKPLVPKKDLTYGKSLPSRHTFCAFLIATLIATIFRSFIGVIALLLAAALAWIRVMEGVHFPRDVFLGAVVGIISGIACTASLLVG